jgi:gluconate 2-dehydrogenase gamma chain
MSEHKPLSRKNFVIAGAGTVAAVAAAAADPKLTDAAEQVAAGASHPAKAPMSMGPLPALGARPEAYAYFTPPEVAFVEAAVERLIPTDAHGPGAKQAGVAYYIDQQLAGRYGRGDTMYTQGPWGAGLPTQGYQLRYTPADVYRLGIAATNAYTMKTYDKRFDRLDAAHQNTVLSALENGSITFDGPPAQTFFNFLLGDTVQGFFADPMYGGNRNKIGWKTIGFPGVGAVYYTTIDKQNAPYNVAPAGIADEMQHAMAMLEGEPVEHVQTRVAARSQKKELA